MAAEPLIRRRGRWWVSGSLDVAGQSLARWRSLWLPLLCLSLIWTLVRHPGVTAVAAGIALFLFGMFFMEQGFGQLASARWQQGLRGLTATLPRAFATGFFSTVFTQSSALVALLTLSFLSARMLDVMAGIGIMAGASLGTTSGGWLIATLGLHASPGQLAMPLLVTGMLLISLPRWGLRGGGMALAGVGFMFLGIDYIRQGFSHLADLMSLTRYTVPGMTGMVVYFLGGVALAAALQSSHAALLLIMAALQAGQLDYDNALALVLGINVGATSPVLLGAWHAAHSGRQLALLDTLFKLATALWCLLLFIPLRWVNEGLAGACGLGGPVGTQPGALSHPVQSAGGGLVITTAPTGDALAQSLVAGPNTTTAFAPGTLSEPGGGGASGHRATGDAARGITPVSPYPVCPCPPSIRR